MNLKTETENGETLLTTRNAPSGIVVEPSYITYLRNQGYTIEDVIEKHSVPSSDGESSYLVYLIQTYLFPKNSALLDVADESQQIELWVCSCPQFTFRERAEVSAGVEITPDQCGTCKHCEQVDKSLKAANDDQQETLL